MYLQAERFVEMLITVFVGVVGVEKVGVRFDYTGTQRRLRLRLRVSAFHDGVVLGERVGNGCGGSNTGEQGHQSGCAE